MLINVMLIKNMYGISMTSESRQNDVIFDDFVILCTLKLTKSTTIVSIHAISVLYKSAYHLTKFEAVPVTYDVDVTA